MSSVVSLIILTADVHSERRFDLHTSVKQLKTKLEQITGIPSDSQRLLLYNNEDDANANKGPISDLGDEERALGYFGIRDGLVVKVIDTNPSTSFAGEFSDVSRVEKFEISEEEYAKRQDTVLAYKQLHKVGRFAPQPTTSEPLHKALPEVVVGARCEVIIDNMAKRGTVRFVGETEFGKVKGDWVGVEYDEPVGKHDGSIEGKRYFTCRPSCGAFIRPDKVKIGDFPELPLEDEEM